MKVKYAQVYWFDKEGNFINKVSSSLPDEAVNDLNLYCIIKDFNKVIEEYSNLPGIQDKLNKGLTGVFLVEESSQHKLIKL